MSYSIGFDIFAKDGASATFDKLGKKVGETESKFSKSTKALAAGAAVVATAVIAFGKKSIDTFGAVGAESLKLQRYMGGTIEDASRLRYAGTQSGIGVDVLTTSMGKLSKALVASGSSAKASAAMTKLLGFSAKDAHGNMLPMSTLMPQLADKFKAMPAGAEKTALALQLFGKQGMAMIPMMDKGSAGLKAMSAESDKFGNTLDTKDTAAVKENVKQKREMNAAMEGLQIMLGRVLMPVVVEVSTKLNEMARWFNENATTAKPLLAIIAGLVAILGSIIAITRVYTVVQTALNVVMAMNPIGLVVVGIGLLIGAIVLIATKTTWFQTIWATMTGAIGTAWQWMWNSIIAPVIRFILNGFANIAGGIGTFLRALSGIPGFGWAKTAADAMDGAARKARDLANGIKDIKSPPPIEIHYYFTVSGKAPVIAGSPTGAFNIPGRAIGGPVSAGQPYIVGDGGRPELFVPNVNGTIFPRVPDATQSRSAVGSSASSRIHPADIAALSGAIADALKSAASSTQHDSRNRPRS